MAEDSALSSKKRWGAHYEVFTTVVGAPTWLTSASVILVLLLSNEIVKKFSVNNGKEKTKRRKIVLLAKNYLNITEKIISKPLTDLDINHEEQMLVINEEQWITIHQYTLKNFGRIWL